MNKTKIVTALVFAGVSLGMAPTCFAASVVADGTYQLQIAPTPTVTVPGVGTFNEVGNATVGWNSTFTFGEGTPSYVGSQGMKDNGNLGTSVGSSIAGDGFAGVVGLAVFNGAFNITSFSVDTIATTPGGNFGQSGTITGGGAIDAAGNMTLTPTGRMGSIDGEGTIFIITNQWNIQPGTTGYNSFTTGTSSNYLGSINGNVVTAVGDINADGITDYSVTLVSSGHVGSVWGPGFMDQGYIEVWKGNIVSAVPVPAAAWLLGSGLIGLIGAARRRR